MIYVIAFMLGIIEYLVGYKIVKRFMYLRDPIKKKAKMLKRNAMKLTNTLYGKDNIDKIEIIFGEFDKNFIRIRVFKNEAVYAICDTTFDDLMALK